MGEGRAAKGLGGSGGVGSQDNRTESKDTEPISQPKGTQPNPYQMGTSAELGIPWADDPIRKNRHMRSA